MRWLRRVARWCVKTWLIATIASLTFNSLVVPPSHLRAADGRDVDVNGTRVHYQQWGTKGSPIVLIHGFAESTVSWAATASILARHHAVVALDLPGFGYSQYTGRYALTDEVATVSGLIGALHIQHPVVVGHSLGAAVAGELARTQPHLISGVIFADGDAMPVPGGGGRSAMSWVLRTPYARSIYRGVTRWPWLDRRIVKAQCGTRCAGYNDALVQAWMRPLTQKAAENAMSDMARQGMLAMTPEHVRAIHVPRGIIWGAQDASGGGSLAGARVNLGQPPTKILARAGHLSMIADPNGFAEATESLMASWHS